MFTHRCTIRRGTIWLIACLQLFVITSYFFLQGENPSTNRASVQFLKSNQTALKRPTFLTLHDQIVLNSTLTRSYYIDFNSSLCYHNGTDVKRMQRSSISWKCECMPNYHGTACSQPEVIWRALLAYRKRLPLKERKEDRKIIYIFEVSDITMTISDIRISELNDAVDLFILYEIGDNGDNSMEKQLRYGFLKQYHRKILYLRLQSHAEVKTVWQTCSKLIASVKHDDIIVHTGHNEVPNVVTLKYLKLYDFKFPEPILLRYRWSVFGFFWLHPNKTKLSPAIVTVKYLQSVLDDNIEKLRNSTGSFIVGDLNHFGGWFCEFCNDPGKIIDELTTFKEKFKQYKDLMLNGALKLNSLSKNQVIDVNTIEDLIENGIYIDGKTDLVKAHRFRDNYFAPLFLQENTWKYDYLMINIYSKMDYYE